MFLNPPLFLGPNSILYSKYVLFIGLNGLWAPSEDTISKSGFQRYKLPCFNELFDIKVIEIDLGVEARQRSKENGCFEHCLVSLNP